VNCSTTSGWMLSASPGGSVSVSDYPTIRPLGSRTGSNADHRLDGHGAARSRNQSSLSQGAGQTVATQSFGGNEFTANLGMDLGNARVDSGCAHHRGREDCLRSRCHVATEWGVDGGISIQHSEFSQNRGTWRLTASFMKLLFMPAAKGQSVFHNSVSPKCSVFFG
jgi:hypothetical protein